MALDNARKRFAHMCQDIGSDWLACKRQCMTARAGWPPPAGQERARPAMTRAAVDMPEHQPAG
jgi:hypothetical protein